MTMAVQGRLVEVEPVEAPVVERAPVGTEKTFRAYDQNQVLLMAPSIGNWVPEGHWRGFVSDLVDEALDLLAIYAAYEEERGFPPCDPTMMVKLLIYGYATATPSSRKPRRRTYSDVAVRFCARISIRISGRSPGFASVTSTRWPGCSCRRCGCANRRGLSGWGRSLWTARSCARTRGAQGDEHGRMVKAEAQ